MSPSWNKKSLPGTNNCDGDNNKSKKNGKTKPSRPKGISGSYLDSLSSSASSVSENLSKDMDDVNSNDNKQAQTTPKGIAGNYLETLSSQHGTSSEPSFVTGGFTPYDELKKNPFVEEVGKCCLILLTQCPVKHSN
jgi:hypothetical protein